jgi:hypothetical protein
MRDVKFTIGGALEDEASRKASDCGVSTMRQPSGAVDGPIRPASAVPPGIQYRLARC